MLHELIKVSLIAASVAVSIKSFEGRKDSKDKDTFDLSDWWKSNCGTLPGGDQLTQLLSA